MLGACCCCHGGGDKAIAPNPPCEHMFAAVGVGCWALSPSPVHTSLPPYEQLLVAEGSDAMGVIVSQAPSPLCLLSSCPALVLWALALMSSSPPLPPHSTSPSPFAVGVSSDVAGLLGGVHVCVVSWGHISPVSVVTSSLDSIKHLVS